MSGTFIAGAQFQLTYANGGYVDNDNGHLSSNGPYTTDDKGEIRISGITETVVAKEVPAPGYVIDQSTQTQTVTSLVPSSTVVVTETKVPDGYVLNPTPQTITVKNCSNSVNSGTVGGTINGNTGSSSIVGGKTNGGNDLVFENDPIGTFELIKVVEENKEKRIPNTTFEICRVSDDALVETVTTSSDGRVSLKLDAGDYYAMEIEVAKGCRTPRTTISL